MGPAVSIDGQARGTEAAGGRRRFTRGQQSGCRCVRRRSRRSRPAWRKALPAPSIRHGPLRRPRASTVRRTVLRRRRCGPSRSISTCANTVRSTCASASRAVRSASTSRPIGKETADALARDDASLREVLHRAGYEAGQVQVDKRDAAGPRLGDAAASGQQQAGGAGSGASSGQMAGDQRAATPHQRPQAQRGGDAFALHEQDTQDVPRQDRYRDPDRLYV